MAGATDTIFFEFVTVFSGGDTIVCMKQIAFLVRETVFLVNQKMVSGFATIVFVSHTLGSDIRTKVCDASISVCDAPTVVEAVPTMVLVFSTLVFGVKMFLSLDHLFSEEGTPISRAVVGSTCYSDWSNSPFRCARSPS